MQIFLEILNPIAILISTIVGMVLGALWYSPLLFGNAWLNALGKTREQLGPAMPAMIGSIGSCLISATCMSFLVTATGANTLLLGGFIGTLVALGIVAMAMLSDSLFSNWGWKLYFIQAGYRVTYIIVMGAICGALSNP